ncbi:MAG: glycosyltransferase family 4 protein [bacterium]|nr:glycosyltransferase family 4 protein [bacterium]
MQKVNCTCKREIRKVCIISPVFRPMVGGVEDYSYFYTKTLSKYFDTYIITSKCISRGKNIYPLFDKFTVTEYVKLIRLIQNIAPDIVHIQYTAYMYKWWRFNFLLFLLGCKFLTTAQIVITLHELYDPLFFSSTNFFISIIQRLKMPFIIAIADKVIVTANSRYRAISKLFSYKRRRIFQVFIGSNIPLAKSTLPISVKDTIRSKYGISQNEAILSIFGTVNWDKDYETLFKAIKNVNYPLKLLIIGKISNDSRYYNLKLLAKKLDIEKNIVWTNFVNCNEVSLLLNLSTIYVIPLKTGLSGRHTTFPVALEHSLPVITTKGKDTPPFLIDHKNVLFTNIGDSDALRDTIEELIKDENIRNEIGMAGRNLFEKYYSWDRIVEEMVKVYTAN